MSRDGIDLQLEPLAASDVAALAEGIVGRSLPPSVATELAELTNGNPLFVVECARAFRTAGASTRAVLTLPSNVRLVILERVGLLPARGAFSTRARSSVATHPRTSPRECSECSRPR